MNDDTHKTENDDASDDDVKVDKLGRPETSDQYDPNEEPQDDDEAYDRKAKPAE